MQKDAAKTSQKQGWWQIRGKLLYQLRAFRPLLNIGYFDFCIL